MDTDTLNRLHLYRSKGIPEQILEVSAQELWQHLPGSALFHIAGRQEPPLFVSVLLHGNEDTGWDAVRKVLTHHKGRPLPRAMLLFVGNVDAARANVRTLPSQTDYNRTWPGTLYPDTAEAGLLREVIAAVREAKPFASIDIHNNTGHNPHYACVNRLDEPFLHLARLFSRTVVHFTRPVGVQSAAMATLCPAVTVECGRPGGVGGADHAAEFVEAALALSHFPNPAVPAADIDLMKTCAIIKVPHEASLSFDGMAADFMFRPDLDHLNFAELQPGTRLGSLGGSGAFQLIVEPYENCPVARPYLTHDCGEIRLVRSAIPAMLTLDARAVRLDCLGYLMHRIGRDGRFIDA